LDFFGGGYVELAVTELGIAPDRIDTIIDFPALERFGVKFVGNQDGADAAVLGELAALIAAGQLEVPIAELIPLDEVQRAYSTLERRHTRGKIVLTP
jgi:NADPH:quinone reductase-like Zn-dependent oxidoreductase